MPFPKISGVLNNCPMHVLTPELRTEIHSLAQGFTSTSDFMDAYESLKTEFAIFYGLDPSEFTWEAFDILLSTQNAFDLQLILGPVLRKVMAKMMRVDSVNTELARAADENFAEDVTSENFIRYKTEIQADGRYASLSPDEMFVFLAKHLGLRVVVHNGENERGLALLAADDPDAKKYQWLPVIHIYHQGGKDGAASGGHFERAAIKQEQTHDEAYGSQLSLVAGIFRNDTPACTALGMRLISKHYIDMHIDMLNAPDQNHSARQHRYHLTVAQIEKFLYNSLHVPPDMAKALVGEFTPEAALLIASIPEANVDYDRNLIVLLKHHHPKYSEYNTPLKTVANAQQYELALSLMTPAVVQEKGRLIDSQVWPLRGNEISSLARDYVEHILFDEGFSTQLYALCNRPAIAQELSADLMQVLRSDPNFAVKSSAVLRDRAAATAEEESAFRSVSPTRDGTPFSGCHTPRADVVSIHEIHEESWGDDETSESHIISRSRLFSVDSSAEEADADSSMKRPVTIKKSRRPFSVDNESMQRSVSSFKKSGLQVPPPTSGVSTNFWWKSIQFLLGLGGSCAAIAILTCPPVATALGLTTILGVSTTEIALTATVVAGTSALLAASIFAVHQVFGDAEEQGTRMRARR